MLSKYIQIFKNPNCDIYIATWKVTYGVKLKKAQQSVVMSDYDYNDVKLSLHLS